MKWALKYVNSARVTWAVIGKRAGLNGASEQMGHQRCWTDDQRSNHSGFRERVTPGELYR